MCFMEAEEEILPKDVINKSAHSSKKVSTNLVLMSNLKVNRNKKMVSEIGGSFKDLLAY